MPMKRVRLQEAVDQFMTIKRSSRAKPATIKAYQWTLNKLIETSGNFPLLDASPAHIANFVSHLQETRTDNSINNTISHLRKFFEYCRDEKWMRMTDDPMRSHRRVVVPQKERLRVHADDFGRLYEVAPSPLDRAVVSTGLGTLARGSEMTAIRLGHIDFRRKSILLKPVKTAAPEDWMPINEMYEPEFNRWITWYQDVTGADLRRHPDWYFLPSRWSHGNFRGVNQTFAGAGTIRPDRKLAEPYLNVKRCLELIGFPLRDPVTGKSTYEGEHTLRRSGARAMYDHLSASGIPNALDIVSAQLHHSNVIVTMRYIGLFSFRETRDQVLRSMPMYAPRGANVRQLAPVTDNFKPWRANQAVGS